MHFDREQKITTHKTRRKETKRIENSLGWREPENYLLPYI